MSKAVGLSGQTVNYSVMPLKLSPLNIGTNPMEQKTSRFFLITVARLTCSPVCCDAQQVSMIRLDGTSKLVKG